MPAASEILAGALVHAVAPIRVADNGGWSDTWFAGHGKVFNIAVSPYVEVQLRASPAADPDHPSITIAAENYEDRYTIGKPNRHFQKHPLIEAAFDYMHLPAAVDLDVAIFSEAPAGGSTGTSAAVSVALIGALDALTPGRLTPHEVALAAQRIETELLGQQCGVQDQIASAYGGINFIDMFQYPHAAVSRLRLPESTLWELEARLSLVYVGKSHSSSDVHRLVIRELEDVGPEARKLAPLRRTAELARDALYNGDFVAFGQSLTLNTEAQADLNPALVGPHHHAIIEIARRHGALGWKVNGAGGDGGSLTILSGPHRPRQREMLRAIAANQEWKLIPIHLDHHGLRVWRSDVSAEIG